MKQAVFIERDGVLNHARTERQQQISPLLLEEFAINEEASVLLNKLKEAGLILLATTNQPGLSRGYQLRSELDRMHQKLRKELPLDDILVCPHDESDGCPCRKPKPGLFQEAAYKYHLHLDHSYVISNKWQDADAARLAGCTSLMLQSPWLRTVHRDFVLPDLAAITEKVLQLQRTQRPVAA